MQKAGIIFAAALLVIPAVSQAKTLDELLVERGVVAKGTDSGSDMSAGKVYYNKGTRVDFPDSGFTFGINTQFITRYEYTDVDGATDENSQFTVESARVSVSGSALNKEFEYKVEGDFVDSPSIADGWLKWNACDPMWAKMGRYKTGIARQYNNSDWKLQFADRSFVTNEFNFGRSEGLSIGGNMEGFSYGLAAFNDAQDAANTDHLYVANLRYTMGDMDVYSEGDVDNSADHGFTVGAAYAISENDAAEDLDVMNIDAMWKYAGWSVAGEWFSSDDDAAIDQDGWYAQAGYFIVANEVEVAFRYNDLEDISDGWDLGVNYYWWKHQLKAQFNYSQRSDDASDVDTDRFILQLVAWT